MLQEEFRRLVEVLDMPKYHYLDEANLSVDIYYKDGVSLKYKDNKIYVTLLNRAIDYSLKKIGNLKQTQIVGTKEFEFYKNNTINCTLIPYTFVVDGTSKTLSEDINNLVKIIMNGFLNLSKYYDIDDGILLINQRVIDAHQDAYSEIYGYKKKYKLVCDESKKDRAMSNLRISINNLTSVASEDMDKDKKNVAIGKSKRTSFSLNTRFIHILEDGKATWLYQKRNDKYLLIERLKDGFGTQLELQNMIFNHSFVNGEEIIYIYLKNDKKEVIINLTDNTIEFDNRVEELDVNDYRSITNTINSAIIHANDIYELSRIKRK